MTPRKVTFEHVFFETNPSEADAWYKLARSQGDIPADVGDMFWLGRRMEQYSASQLLTVLGDEFVKQLKDLPLNEWSEPIQSARGAHIVRLEEVHEPRHRRREDRAGDEHHGDQRDERPAHVGQEVAEVHEAHAAHHQQPSVQTCAAAAVPSRPGDCASCGFFP